MQWRLSKLQIFCVNLISVIKYVTLVRYRSYWRLTSVDLILLQWKVQRFRNISLRNLEWFTRQMENRTSTSFTTFLLVLLMKRKRPTAYRHLILTGWKILMFCSWTCSIYRRKMTTTVWIEKSLSNWKLFAWYKHLLLFVWYLNAVEISLWYSSATLMLYKNFEVLLWSTDIDDSSHCELSLNNRSSKSLWG